MNSILITYDLRKPGRDYQKLYDAIRALGDSTHPLESVWIVKTNQSALDVVKHLRSYTDSNDALFAIKVSRNFGWVGLTQNSGDWLERNL